MELKEIAKRLKTLKIPTAYLKFTKSQKLPFAVYYEKSAEIKGADGYNLYRECDIAIELYSAARNIELEKEVETAFRDVPLDKMCAYLKDENMHMVSYEFTVTQKTTGG